MGYSSAITARMGMDTSEFKAGIEQAKQAYRGLGQSLEGASEAHGANAGNKLIGALEHKLLGARHLSGALATALGLNIEKISEHIAAAITSGSAEAWKQVIEVQDKIAELIERRNKNRRTDTQEILHLEREIAEIQKQQVGAGGHAFLKNNSILSTLAESPIEAIRRIKGGKGDFTAEEAKQDADRTLKTLEDQAELEERKKKGAEELKKVMEESAEFRAGRDSGRLDDEERIVSLIKQENEIFASIVGKNLSDHDLAVKNAALLKLERDIEESKTRILEKNKKLKEEEAARAEKIRDFIESQESGENRLAMLRQDLARIEKDILQAKKDHVDTQELLNKKTETQLKIAKEIISEEQKKKTEALEAAKADYEEKDKSKLSVDELANIGKFSVGSDITAQNESDSAREIKDLRARAEEARLAGNADEATELRGKAQTIANGLGSLRDSEKSNANPFKEALAKTESTLDQIQKAVEGKFVNQ